MTTLTLLNNVAADTVGDWYNWRGGPGDIFVTADSFGGGTVTIERSNDQGTTAVSEKFTDGVIFTATENGTFYATGWSHGTKVRATLAGATSPVNVKVTV